MDNTKIGNKEAVALLVTITFTHIILNITKFIINLTSSASLLNILYVGIISIIFTCVVCHFLNKFPTFDLLDISNYLGGNLLKWIIGTAYVAYFVFFGGILLHLFSSFLQIIYYPLTKLFYIILFLLIGAVISCCMKHNAVYRSISIFFPFIIISLIFLFFADTPYYDVEKIYPIFGNGLYTTFVSGLCNMFAFQALAYIYFMPPMLKNPEQIKKISINAIVLSCIFLLASLAIIIFMFSGLSTPDELMPLYTVTKYIEFGSFFRKLDSLYFLIWIIAFVSFLSINLKFSGNILRKLTNSKKDLLFIGILAIAVLIISLVPKNYTISTYCSNIVYKYAFFILVIGISFLVLLFATIKKLIKSTMRRWLK